MQKRYKCSRCKKNNATMIHSKRITKKGVTINYWCRLCNTKKCKKYRKTKIGGSKIRMAVMKSTLKHYHKQVARYTLNSALKAGKVKKPKVCTTCGKHKKLEAHHPNYKFPLRVKWLCRYCHADLHRELRRRKIAK